MERELIKPRVIAEGRDWWVIDKPAGYVVNRAQTHNEATIQEYVERELKLKDVSEGERGWKGLLPEGWSEEWGTAEEIFKERSGIAHRLDKETSGVLLVAKNPGALMNFLWQFKERKVKKMYWALVHGRWGVMTDRVNLPLGRKSGERLKWAVRAEGKMAITDYTVLRQWQGIDWGKLKERVEEETEGIGGGGGVEQKNKEGGIGQKRGIGQKQEKIKEKAVKNLYQGFSLVECWPKTGRTHQIRVHMTHLKHPLVGDVAYATGARVKIDRFWCPRQFLMARQLTFIDPRTGGEVMTEVELSEDLEEVLGFLEE